MTRRALSTPAASRARTGLVQPLWLWLAPRIALSGIVPLAGVAVLVVGVLLPQLRADLEAHHQSLARTIASLVDAHLLAAERELRAIAEEHGLQPDPPAASWFGILDAHVGADGVFAAIYVIGADDAVHAAALPRSDHGRRADMLPLDLSHWVGLRKARAGADLVWSETARPAAGGQPAVTLAIPLADKVLVGELAVDRLVGALAQVPAESGMMMIILDRQGRIVADSAFSPGGRRLNLDHLPIVRNAQPGHLVAGRFVLDGKPYIGTPVNVDRLGWIVVVAQPSSEALRPLLSTLWVLAAGGAVAVLLTMGVAVAVARSFARRSGHYAAQVHAIANGDYERRWSVSGIREFDGLAHDLERMSLAIRQREHELENSEARYRLLFDSNPHPMWVYDLETLAFMTVNDAAVIKYGYSRDEFLAMTIRDIRPREDVPRLLQNIASLQPGVDHAGVWRHLKKDGSLIDVEIVSHTLSLQGRSAELVLANDVTERLRAEQKLLKSEHQYRELVENANSIILRWNPAGKITFINDFGLRFFGYAEDELLGRHAVGTIVPPDETTGRDLRPLMDEICRQPDRFEHNVNQNMCRDGTRVWVAWANKAVLGNDGQVIEVFSVGSDITERKRAAAELERHHEHLEELVAERTADLRRAMTQLVQAEKLAALGSLVAGVAHELNTPLGNSRLVASTLAAHLREFSAAVGSGLPTRPQLDHFLLRSLEAVELLERNTIRGAELISHFKEMAVDQTSMRRRRFKLRQTIDEVLTTLRPQLKHTGHHIEVEIADDLELDSYPGPFEQVLVNLVTNSLLHGFATVAAGRIVIHGERFDQTKVTLRYTDNGAGMSAATLKRIFEPFFTTRLGQGGSGLGLYIVYTLVTGVLGGAIEAHSLPGDGTTFTLTLPHLAPELPLAG